MRYEEFISIHPVDEYLDYDQEYANMNDELKKARQEYVSVEHFLEYHCGLNWDLQIEQYPNEFKLYRHLYNKVRLETIKNKIIETEKDKERLERNNVIYVNGHLRKINKEPLEEIHRCERRLCYFYDSVRRLTEIMEKVDE